MIAICFQKIRRIISRIPTNDEKSPPAKPEALFVNISKQSIIGAYQLRESLKGGTKYRLLRLMLTLNFSMPLIWMTGTTTYVAITDYAKSHAELVGLSLLSLTTCAT